jgi:hypothetical protein
MTDTRTFEQVLDITAIVGGVLFLALMLAGVFTMADTGWSIGVFTGWLARHLLR